jgi:CheY-like chemotaxis protein
MSKEVLIVDDTEIVRERTSDLLQGLGYVPVAFETASEAQAYLEGKTNGNTPLGILCDMRIPDELEGPEALFNYLREQGLEQRFYFITGHLSTHDVAVQERTGANLLMKGEYSLPELIKEMEAQYN